jgi:uncharacterized Zn finger protein
MDYPEEEKIIKALQLKGAVLPCPRCSTLEFEIIGETEINVHNRAKKAWGKFGPSQIQVPVILVSCKNCGYLSQHAKRLLDL